MTYLDKQLEHLVREEGYRQMGQVAIDPLHDGSYVLCHWEDAPRAGRLTEIYEKPEDALKVGLHDDAGGYRPLKTAPTLRHGWKMRLWDAGELRRALDLFYPALIGAFLAHQRGQLPTTSMLSTMGRQTGMYQRVRDMSAAQGDELCGTVCPSSGGCLRTILWDVEPGYGKPGSQPPEKFDPAVNQTASPNRTIPLLCFEICNILVAKGRGFMKKQQDAATPARSIHT